MLVAVLVCASAALAQPTPTPNFTLQKFIAANNPCPTPAGNPTSINVNAGDMVTYCYVVTNATGAQYPAAGFDDLPITYSTHTITDTQFGDLTAQIKDQSGTTVGGMFNLWGARGTPCAGPSNKDPSHYAYVEVTQTITTNTTNTATWNASNGSEKCTECPNPQFPGDDDCDRCTRISCTPPMPASPASATSNQVQVSVNSPTLTPTQTATRTPTLSPSTTPTQTPTVTPTQTPTITPTQTPSDTPTNTPTSTSTRSPTSSPTQAPSDLGLGAMCSSPIQCRLGFCANGVCCDQACNQPGQVCNSAGTCIQLSAVPAASWTGIVMLVVVCASLGTFALLIRRAH